MLVLTCGAAAYPRHGLPVKVDASRLRREATPRANWPLMTASRRADRSRRSSSQDERGLSIQRRQRYGHEVDSLEAEAGALSLPGRGIGRTVSCTGGWCEDHELHRVAS